MTPAEHVQRFLSIWRILPQPATPAMVEFKAGLEKMLAFAVREAGEEMRERAAKRAATCGTNPYRDSDVVTNVRMDIAEAIRAIPLD